MQPMQAHSTQPSSAPAAVVVGRIQTTMAWAGWMTAGEEEATATAQRQRRRLSRVAMRDWAVLAAVSSVVPATTMRT